MNEMRVAARERGAIQSVEARRSPPRPRAPRRRATTAPATSAATAPARAGRTARIADAAVAQLRLLAERRAGTTNERDALCRQATTSGSRRSRRSATRSRPCASSRRTCRRTRDCRACSRTRASIRRATTAGCACRPHSLMNGIRPCPSTPARRVAVARYGRSGRPSRRRPSCRRATAPVAAPSRRARHAPLPSVFAAQIARSPPSGSWLGFATHPLRFGSPPRTNVTVEPSSEIASSEQDRRRRRR